MKRTGFLALVCLVLACVSRSVPEERYSESVGLPTPVFSVQLADPEHYSFAIVGDLHVRFGDTSRLERILGDAAAEGDAFVILLGDNVDDGQKEDFLAVKRAIEKGGWSGKVLPVLGNHDIFGDGWMYYREILGPSHYSVSLGNAKFIALDTADGTITKDEKQWIEEQVAQSRPTHLFFLSHYLPTVPGQRTYLKIADAEEARRLMKFASDRKVTAWLGAHYHSYATGSVDGVEYVVAGGGGNRRMPPVLDYFYVQVTVAGKDVRYQMHVVP